MEELGVFNPKNSVTTIGIEGAAVVKYNVLEPYLVEESIAAGEAVLTADGAVRAVTGQHTGRSPKDKFVVRDEKTEDKIWWDNNKPMSPEHFAVLKKIHAPARAKMLPHFAHAFADCSHVTQVAVLSFFQPANEARSSRVVTHTVQPSGKLSSAFDDEHGI